MSNNQNKSVNVYINNAPDFAYFIAKKLREIIFRAEPNIIEGIKWGSPSYSKNSLICSIVVFNNYVALWFYKGALIKDSRGLFEKSDAKSMRSIKFKDVKDVNENILISYIKEAVGIDLKGILVKEKVIPIPFDFKKALQERNILESFEKMSYTHKKEYIRWINEAKKPETRAYRVKKAVNMISKGKKFS